MSRNYITCYTDGSASTHHEKLGGHGIYIVEEDGAEHFYSAGFKNTKTGRQELMGVINCLRMIKDKEAIVHIYCDSQYVVHAITKGWMKNWKRKCWVGIKNPDLIIQYYNEYIKFKTGPKLFHIKGHTKNEDIHSLGNAIVDVLADYRTHKEYKQDLIE
jgi:ribonuclease HI